MFNIVSSGIFHYRFYVKFLSVDFGKIYFSHRLNSSLDVTGDKRINIFPREYLLGLHIKLFGPVSAYKNITIYNTIWAFLICILYKPSNTNLILLQGSSLPLLKKLKKKGKFVIGEVVNCHPAVLLSIMESDANAHGVKFFWTKKIYKLKLKELSYIDYLLAPSRFVAESYINNGFPKEKIKIIPYGVEQKSFKILNPMKSDKEASLIKVVCVGQVLPRKGQYHLAKSLSSIETLTGKTISLELVGIADTQYLHAIQKVNKHITYTGPLSHSDVLLKMQSADVTVLNSLEDGFGMVALESISVGTPVVVSKFAGVSELLKDSKAAIVVDPLNYDEIINAILELSNQEVDVNTLNQIPTWNDYANSLEEWIKELQI